MHSKIQKWGNSLGLRVPKAFAEEIGFEEHGDVELSLVRGALVVRPVKKPSVSLDELLAGVTSRNRHGEMPSGGPVGREAW